MASCVVVAAAHTPQRELRMDPPRADGLGLSLLVPKEAGVSVEWICQLLEVLEEPVRRSILLRLAGPGMTAETLASSMRIDRLTLNEHLVALSQRGLISADRAPKTPILRLQDSVAVAFVEDIAEARITAPNGEMLSFITNVVY